MSTNHNTQSSTAPANERKIRLFFYGTIFSVLAIITCVAFLTDALADWVGILTGVVLVCGLILYIRFEFRTFYKQAILAICIMCAVFTTSYIVLKSDLTWRHYVSASIILGVSLTVLLMQLSRSRSGSKASTTSSETPEAEQPERSELSYTYTVTSRRKVGLMRYETIKTKRTIGLECNELVEMSVVCRLDENLIEDEHHIHYAKRKNIWSRLPQQIGVLLLQVLNIAVPIWTLRQPASEGNWSLILIASAVIMILLIFTQIYIWMTWNYEYLVITDERMMLVYKPPLNLPGYFYKVDLKSLLEVHAKDTFAGNYLNYGTINGETAADKIDAWIRDGIQFVASHTKAANLVNQLTLSAKKPRPGV